MEMTSTKRNHQGNSNLTPSLVPAPVMNLHHIFLRRPPMKTRHVIAAAVLSLATAVPSHAQVRSSSLLLYYPPPPPPTYVDTVGTIEWSAVASGCFVNSTASAAINVYNGSVTFNGSASGDIYLTCPVGSVMGTVNAFSFNAHNDNGYVGGVNHCYVDSALMRRNIATGATAKLASPSTWNLSLSGQHSLTGATSVLIQEADLTSNLFWAVIHLNRDASLSCNPEADGAFLHYVIF
jgi:hypothetical protein